MAPDLTQWVTIYLAIGFGWSVLSIIWNLLRGEIDSLCEIPAVLGWHAILVVGWPTVAYPIYTAITTSRNPSP